jgi:cytosine/adenosine deaminase-related metal-dependent hydrolase
MALVIGGRVAALDRDGSAIFKGRVWIGDDGRIDAVTHGSGPAPAGFQKAPIVDVGSAYVMPGIIDLHNHLGYNTLPLWTEPKQKVPFAHHDSWPNAPTYKPDISWPAWVLAKAAPEALLAYVQTRALVGGTTSIQGWPAANREHDQLLRNIDTEKAGSGKDLILTSALTKTPVDLARIGQAEAKGTGFIYHCAEGQPGSIVAREFTDAATAGCLAPTFFGIHCTSVGAGDWKLWTRDRAGALVWSPFSNYWLYGCTTDVPDAIRQKVSICLGSDWGPSGTKHVLAEVKVAKLASTKLGFGLKDEDFVAMVTTNAGDALARCWGVQVGRLVKGGFGDVTVLRSRKKGSFWADVVAATEKEVALVVVGGQARYGDADLMTDAKASPASSFNVGQLKRKLAIPDPNDPKKAWSWAAILAELEDVRKDPAGSLKKAEKRRSAFAGRVNAPDAPLELMLDMPSGGMLAFAGPPPHPDQVIIPPLPSLVHDKAFFDSIHGCGFHGTLLDGLAKFY